MKLKAKFTLIVSVFVVTLCSLVAFFTYVHYKNSIKETIAQQQFRMVSILAAEIDSKLLAAQQHIVSVAQNAPPDIMQDPEKAQAFLDNMPSLHIMFDNKVFLFTPAGKMFVESPNAPNRRGLDFSFRDYISNTIKTNKPYISDPYISTLPHKHPVIMFTVPLFDGRGKIKGILGGGIDLMRDNFLGRIGTVKLGEEGYLYLTTIDRAMIMHPDKKRILTKQTPGMNRLYDKAIEGFEGTDETTTSYGIKMLASFKRMKVKNWILAANTPQTEAYLPIRQAERSLLIVTVIGLIAIFSIISYIIKYLTKPLELFTRHIEELPQKTGGDRLLDVSTRDEIGTLSLSFNRMETERRQGEEALRDSEERFRSLSEASLEGVMVHDQGIILDCNLAFARLFGYEQTEELIGKNGIECLLTPESQASIRQRILRQDKGLLEVFGVRKDGTEFVMETESRAMKYRGRDARIITCRDISERKRAEELVRRSEERMRLFFERQLVGMAITSPEKGWLQVNDHLCEILGRSQDELARLTWAELTHPEDLESDLAQYNRMLAGDINDYSMEKRFIRKDGTVIFTNLSVACVRKSEGSVDYVLVLVEDVTSRKMAEQKIQESELRYKTLFDSAGDAILLMSEGIFIDCNRKTFEMFGCTKEQIFGESPCRFSPPHQPDGRDSREKALEKIAAALAGNPESFEWTHTRVDGTLFDAEVTLTRLDLKSRGYLQAIVRDITGRKKLEKQLLQAQKLEAVGTLAGGIAHDFNNILQAMMGYLSLFLMKAPAELDVSYIKQTESMIDNATGLTRGLLAFSRKEHADMSLFDLNEIVSRFHALIARIIGEQVIVHVRLAPGKLNIIGNQGLLEQVLMNMAINARDAMPDGGELRFEVDAIDLSEAAALVNGCDRPGSYARISITDTGTGMSYDMTQKIFDPFFTTKEIGKGTGLGLAISFGTIRQHGGNITVYSEERVGTTFRIYLPLSGDAPAFTQQEQLDVVLGGTETVLLVEDFGPARDTVRIVLEAHGYRVIEAVDGEDALAKFRASENKIDIVVTDVIMPNMNGKDLADRIRQEKPDTRFIFVSGYTPETLQEKWHEELGVVMAKPVSPALLARKIREVLDDVRS